MHCGEQIGYLPFKCKYCGGTFCKKHRLPENHECSFELKHTPVVPISSGEPPRRYQELTLKKPKKREYEYRSFKRTVTRKTKYKGTKFLMFMILIFSVVAFIFSLIELHPYLYLSVHGLLYYFSYHTFFTALFIGSGPMDPIGLFLLFIILYFLYLMARVIEIQYGPKFLISLYILSGLFSAMIFVLLRFLLHFYYPIETYPVYVGLAWGGVLGIISFSIFPYYNRKITGLMYFIPMRMKGKTFLIIIVLVRLIPGLFFSLFSPLNIIYYLPDLGGILAAYLVFRIKFKYR